MRQLERASTMPTIIHDADTDVLEGTGVDTSEVPSSPQSAPLAQPPVADVESWPDVPAVEQGCEPPALSAEGDAETHAEVDEDGNDERRREEVASGLHYPGRHLPPKPPAPPPAISDPPGGAPKVAPCIAQLEEMLNEQNPLKTMKEFLNMESQRPIIFESPDEAAGTGPEPQPVATPKPSGTDDPQFQRESQSSDPDPADNDGSATSRLCFETIDKLCSQDQEFSLEEREAMMQGCLSALLTEFDLHQDGTTALVDMLHDADAESYLKCAKQWITRGLFVSVGVLDSTAMYIWNQVMIVRPCFIHDLGLCDTDDIATLDAALAAYINYLQLNAEVRRSNWNEHHRNLKRVAILDRLNNSAQNSLKLYLGIMKDLRRAKSKRDAEDSRRQPSSPVRSHRPAPTTGRTVAGQRILREYRDANSAERLSPSSGEDVEVQS